MNNQDEISKLSAKLLHEKGCSLREEDGFVRALIYLDQAIIKYQVESDYGGLVDALKDRVLTWKHLYLTTNDLVYAIFAEKDAQAMLDISKYTKLNDKFSTSFFRLGEVAMLFKKYPEAVMFYKKALLKFAGHPSEKGDFRYHLGEALYLWGKKDSGKRNIIKGLSEIIKNKEGMDDFVINVWVSGAYKTLATLLKKNEPVEAEKYFKLAKRIVDSDNRLIVRKRQLEELGKDFGKKR